MKNAILFICLLLGVIFSVDAKSIRKKVPPEIKQSPIQRLSLRHTTCFGRCPDINIEINKDGLVKYTGLRFVKDSGLYQKRFAVAKVQNLLNRFNDSQVDTCEKEYFNRIPDVAGMIFTITYADSVKKIYNAQFGPMWLRQLANGVDSFGIIDKSWTKISPAKKPKKHAGK
jgi:Domain of unknown function (DUF6438)